MRLDALSMFSDEQAITGTSVDSTKTLDILGAGVSEVEFFLMARFTDEAHGCKKVALMGSDDKSTFTEVTSQGVTDNTEGAGVTMRLPQGCPRYLKVVYTGTSMKGKVTCGLTLCAPSPRGKRIGDFQAT